MIFLSILAKTFALALGPFHLVPAALCWLASMFADVVVIRRTAGKGAVAKVARTAMLWNLAALVLGLGVAALVSYAAMRWKDGLPGVSHLIATLLQLVGVPAGVHEGRIFVTTMAGPLEFAASIDHLGLRVPALFLAVSAAWLLTAMPTLGGAIGRLGTLATVLTVTVVLRTGLWILLVLGVSDFIGYETDELPFRPFVDESAMMWLYLPFLLAAGAVCGRFLPAPHQGERPPVKPLPRLLKWLGVPLLLLLFGAIFWQPAGTAKEGKVVFSNHHTQWSRTDRPYDREWYGADSGYNYACMKRLFEVFYPVVETDERLSAELLEDASILVIYIADKALTKDELELVHDFVRAGGGLFLFGDHTNVFGSTSNINDVCGRFGFQYRDDVLFDLDEDFHQVLDPPAWGPASRFWHGMAYFKLRGPCSIRPTSLTPRSVYQVGNAKGIRAIYSVNNFYPPPHDYPRMKTGEFCVAATSRYGRGRIAAWADSTVFSNFEIFYPGKYEYLVNTLDWLNHRDALVVGLAQRALPLLVAIGLAVLLLRWRDPRIWLATLVVTVTAGAAAWTAATWWDGKRAEFPAPAKPADWIFFAAHTDDPAYHLREFITEEPYDERYEVFIQWVLRTGAYSGFHLLSEDHVEGFHEHLRAAEGQRTALALIVRKPEDLPQLDELGRGPARHGEPILLLFDSAIPAEQAVERLRRAGIVTGDEALAQIAGAWPAGEATVEADGRRVMVIAGSERFSDRSMGITEKVRPNAEQRASFDRMFGIIDRFLGKEAEAGAGE